LDRRARQSAGIKEDAAGGEGEDEDQTEEITHPEMIW
jgi:hypothetical protein